MATMSKKHFELLARTLGRAVAVEASEGGGEGTWAASAAYRAALAVADALADTSPRYDGARFIDAVESAIEESAPMLGIGEDGTRCGARRAIQDATYQRRASRY